MYKIGHWIAASLIISTGFLAVGYYENGLWIILVSIVIYRCLGGVGIFRSISWVSDLVFVLDFSTLFLGVLLGFANFLLIIGMIGSLMVWDLAGYHQRIKRIGPLTSALNHQSRHIKILVLTTTAGGILAVIPLGIQLNSGFESAIFLSILSILGVVIGIKLAKQKI